MWAGASGILRHVTFLSSAASPCSLRLSQVGGDAQAGAIRNENPWLEILSVSGKYESLR